MSYKYELADLLEWRVKDVRIVQVMRMWFNKEFWVNDTVKFILLFLWWMWSQLIKVVIVCMF